MKDDYSCISWLCDVYVKYECDITSTHQLVSKKFLGLNIASVIHQTLHYVKDWEMPALQQNTRRHYITYNH